MARGRLQRQRLQGRQNVVEGGDRRTGVAGLAGAVETLHGGSLGLVQQGCELGEGGHSAVAAHARRHGQREHAAQRVALAAGMAVLGHLAEEFEQTAQRLRVGGLAAGGPGPGRIVGGLGQLAGRVGLHFVHENLLGLAVAAPLRRGPRQAGVAAGLPQPAPVGGAVAGAGKALRVHERLRQQDRKAMLGQHVVREPSQAQAQHPRGQVGPALPRRQNHKARVLQDQMQAPPPLLRTPPDPAVAGCQLERGGLPAHQGQPALPLRRHMPHGLAEQALKRQVVVGRHQAIPAPVLLCPPRGAHAHRAQIQVPPVGWRSH